MLTDQAIMTTPNNDQMLTIRDAKITIINLNEIYQEGALDVNIPATVTAMQPQKEAREFVVNMYNLNAEQRRAFLIITEHLDDVNVVLESKYLFHSLQQT